jgi:hypothetical protein
MSESCYCDADTVYCDAEALCCYHIVAAAVYNIYVQLNDMQQTAHYKAVVV